MEINNHKGTKPGQLIDFPFSVILFPRCFSTHCSAQKHTTFGFPQPPQQVSTAGVGRACCKSGHSTMEKRVLLAWVMWCRATHLAPALAALARGLGARTVTITTLGPGPPLCAATTGISTDTYASIRAGTWVSLISHRRDRTGERMQCCPLSQSFPTPSLTGGSWHFL